MEASRHRILFFAEAVTLAHVARPMLLAQSLDAEKFDITVACDPRYQSLFSAPKIRQAPIKTIPGEQFLAALASGSPLYDQTTLREYIKEDLDVINQFKPQLIIGDFRLSLSISARIAGIPYISLSNIYWSPYAKQHYPVPDLLLTKIVGTTLGQLIFSMARPLAFALHTIPLNRLRKEFGLSHLGWNLPTTYTDADYTLYADIPGLIGTHTLPSNHQLIGPIIWSPRVELPDWWNQLPDNIPIIYITLGSSGRSELLPDILNTLSELPVVLIAATAGRIKTNNLAKNVYVADFLPGTESAKRSDLVICNGGSPSSQQALAEGTPVLGIASNLDQHLNMAAIEHAGAGVKLRSDQAIKKLHKTVKTILETPRYKKNAQVLAAKYREYSAPERFNNLVKKVLAT